MHHGTCGGGCAGVRRGMGNCAARGGAWRVVCGQGKERRGDRPFCFRMIRIPRILPRWATRPGSGHQTKARATTRPQSVLCVFSLLCHFPLLSGFILFMVPSSPTPSTPPPPPPPPPLLGKNNRPAAASPPRTRCPPASTPAHQKWPHQKRPSARAAASPRPQST